MKAVDANLLVLLKKCSQFVVPIYQRAYSWGEPECNQLWEDVIRAGARTDLANHFTGSIVYIEKDQGTNTAAEPDLIIDGQQRVTTVTLLLAALAEHLESRPKGEQEPFNGFAPEKIRGLYLTNTYESDDAFFKLILSKGDRDALKAIIRKAPMPDVESRIPANFRLLQTKISNSGVGLDVVCRGLSKLVVVDVRLTRGVDDPQLVFESMNSTGKKLSEADLIRNFVLMDLQPSEQTKMYEDYWYPMEKDFKGDNEGLFDQFVFDYLTLKTGQIPRLNRIYESFKSYAFQVQSDGMSRDALVKDLWQHAHWFGKMALGGESKPALAALFAEIRELRATVVYPFLLRLYADCEEGRLTETDFALILESVVAYVFRRSICQVPTNTLRATFAALPGVIEPDNYLESVWGCLLTLSRNRRFPTDSEFSESLRTNDVYHSRRPRYLLRKLENFGRKEEVPVAEYTIEHIMPQNQNLSRAWQQALGSEWQDVQKRYLNTLGNLTLTGYNPEYSDRPFLEKRDMKGGFKESPLRLNHGLGQVESWSAEEIEKRAERLAAQALRIWKRPELSDDVLALYRARSVERGRFDWSMTHAILAAIPRGKWTSYHELAEAVGTAAQPLGSHMTSCGVCPNPYRVLTWDGRVAESFRWSGSDEQLHPLDLLANEGVRFVDKRADSTQQLLQEDLLALVDELD